MHELSIEFTNYAVYKYLNLGDVYEIIPFLFHRGL